MKKQSFLQGAFILMIAGFINRILGFILRIILVRLVGDEGLGLFQMVYPLFMTLLLISTAGFPVAISKLIPERLADNDRQGAFHLLKVTLIFVLLMSITVALFLFLSAEFIAEHIYSDQRTRLILLAIIPALLLSPLAASFRGFFQGFHTMMPTAVSQIIEQISRMTGTLILINLVSYLGLKYQAASISLGISIGELAGLVVLILLFINHLVSSSKKDKDKNRQITTGFLDDLKKISRLAVPITLGRIVNSLMMSGEAVLIPRQLQISGLSLKQSTSIYGQLSGMVEQVIFLPTVITIALTVSLIPNVSDAYARNNLDKIRNNYQDVIRITTYLGFPMTIIFLTRGQEICQLLFGYPQAGVILATMALSSTFIYYLQVSSGLLNGLGKPQLALINLGIGSIIKLLGIFFLTSQPHLRIQGAALSITLGFMVSAILNFISIGHTIGYRLNLKETLFKPIFSSFILFLINPYLNYLFLIPLNLNNRLLTLIILILLVLIYLLIMVLIRAIRPEDLDRIRNRK